MNWINLNFLSFPLCSPFFMWLFSFSYWRRGHILLTLYFGFEHVTCFSQLNEVILSEYPFSTYSLSSVIVMRSKASLTGPSGGDTCEQSRQILSQNMDTWTSYMTSAVQPILSTGERNSYCHMPLYIYGVGFYFLFFVSLYKNSKATWLCLVKVK